VFAHELYCTEIKSFKKYFELSRKERKMEITHLKKKHYHNRTSWHASVCVHVAVCIGIQTQNWTYITCLAISLHPEDTVFAEH